MPFIGFYPSYRYRYGFPFGGPAYPLGLGVPVVQPPLVHAAAAVPIPVPSAVPVPVGMGMGMGYASAPVGYGYGYGYGVPPPMPSGHVRSIPDIYPSAMRLCSLIPDRALRQHQHQHLHRPPTNQPLSPPFPPPPAHRSKLTSITTTTHPINFSASLPARPRSPDRPGAIGPSVRVRPRGSHIDPPLASASVYVPRLSIDPSAKLGQAGLDRRTRGSSCQSSRGPSRHPTGTCGDRSGSTEGAHPPRS